MTLTAQEQLLARAATLADDAPAAWARWRQAGGGLDDLAPEAVALLPRVYRHLAAAQVEDPDMPRLRGVYRHAWVTNERLLHRGAPGIEALELLGIPTLVLGAVSLNTHLADAGARPLNRIDVLVAPEHRARAAACIAESGQVVMRSRVFRRGDAGLWAHRVPAAVGRARTHAPGRTEQLLLTCAWRSRRASDRLVWMADVATLARGDIDWNRLVDGARRQELALTVGRALRLARAALEAPVPHAVLTELTARASVRERVLLAPDRLRR